MKKTTKKIILGLGMSLLGTVANAQDGLEKIIVEKYYVSTAADSIGSVGTLPVGSTTYRVYADMLPGYKFQALYGNVAHPLKISTSTSFFNNEDFGATTANAIKSTKLGNNTIALDSWFSVGASAGGQFGVLKSEDDGKVNLLTLNSLLKNNAVAMGIPLTEQDGNQAGSPVAVTFVGIDPSNELFDATSQQGNSFVTTDGAISALGGATGPTADNRVLIGQFTTDGIFSFEFNIQIGTPTPGVSQKYVVSNQINGEKTIASLKYEANNVSITSPSDNATLLTGDIANITASVVNNDATVSQVEFFVDGKSIGIDIDAPYEKKYTTVKGTHVLTAIEKDNLGDSLVSKPITITVNDNQAPIVTIITPKTAITGDEVTFTSTATDADGTVTQVEFFVDNTSVGIDAVAPYSIQWKSTNGEHKVKAIATDNRALTGTSSDSTIIVNDNQVPTITVAVSPTATEGDKVDLTATANDIDGTVASVEFFVDGNSVGKINAAPFTLKWNAIVGTHKVNAIATDNKGLIGTSKDSTIIVKLKENIAPVVTIGVAATATTGDTVALTATANDTDGIVASVEFFVDGNSVGVVNSAPFTINWKSIVGTHKVKAIATDNKGLTGTSTEETIQVTENQAPTVNIEVAPTAMTGDTVTLIADAKDVDGTVASVEFFVDGNSVGKINAAPFTLKWNAIVGTHKVNAIATDNKGLIGTSKDSTIIVKLKENIAPVVTIGVAATATTGDTVALTATANDTDGIVASVEFFVDGNSVGVVNSAPFTINWKSIVGTHKVKAIATDNKGLTGTSNDSTIIVNDNQVPTITVAVSPTATEGDKVDLTATANDIDGTVASVEFFVDGNSVGKINAAPFTLKWNAIVGTHKVIAIATDNKGLTGTSKDSTIIVKENVAPVVTIGVAGSAMTGDMVALTATANDVDGTVDSVQFFVDGTYLGTVKSAPYSINWNAISGTHKVKAVATDNKGLKGTSKDSTIIVKDNVAPIITVSNPANAITGDSIVISATASDSDGTISSVEFFVDDVSVGTDATSPYTVSYKTTVGKHFIKAVATDNFGLKGTSKKDSITVVNNQAPAVTIQSPKNAITGDEVTFTSTAEDKDGTITQVEFFVDNVSVGFDNTMPYSMKWSTKKGVHKVKAIATDNRGFTGTSADSILEVEDNKAPLVELIVDSIAKVGANVLITANATDTDGSIKKIEFFIDNVVLASDSIAPYTSTWKAIAGKHSVKILATDNRGLTTTKTKDIMVTNSNVSIEKIAANLQTLVYPNPANQELSIIASENASLEITDISGKVIAYKNVLIANTTHHIAISEFSAGVYLVRIFNDNYTRTERVVINN